MPEDKLKIAGGVVTHGVQEVLSGVADLIGETAKAELERRHSGSPEIHPDLSRTESDSVLSRAITSDELDAQIPKP